MRRPFEEVLRSMKPGESVIYGGDDEEPTGPSLSEKLDLLAEHYMRLEERLESLEALLAHLPHHVSLGDDGGNGGDGLHAHQEGAKAPEGVEGPKDPAFR